MLSCYKLLIIQTAHQYPGQAWLDYDLAFRKDAADSDPTDWSKMNLDLYNFCLRTPQAWSTHQMMQASARTNIVGDGDQTPPSRYCHSWNGGQCHWASAVFATPANDATGSTPKSTAPISPTLDSALTPPPQLRREVGLSLHRQRSVHSVNSTVCQSLCLVPVEGIVLVAFRSLVGPPPIVVLTSSGSPCHSVGFVSPLVVSKFQIELCNHPVKAAVPYVLEDLKHSFALVFLPLHVHSNLSL